MHQLLNSCIVLVNIQWIDGFTLALQEIVFTVAFKTLQAVWFSHECVSCVYLLQHIKNSADTNKFDGWPDVLEIEGCVPQRMDWAECLLSIQFLIAYVHLVFPALLSPQRPLPGQIDHFTTLISLTYKNNSSKKTKKKRSRCGNPLLPHLESEALPFSCSCCLDVTI